MAKIDTFVNESEWDSQNKHLRLKHTMNPQVQDVDIDFSGVHQKATELTWYEDNR